MSYFDSAEYKKKENYFLDNHDEKELILDETKRDLKRIIDMLTCVYQLTETQAISLLQDLLYASDELK